MKARQKTSHKHDAQGIAEQYKALSHAYGPLAKTPKQKPLDSLVQTILSQNTTDINSDEAYRLLRIRFPKWEQVLKADTQAIAETIRTGGLAHIKSERIQKTLQMIQKKEGKLSLAALKKLDIKTALEYLVDLPGVGVKTACCVLLFGFGMPVMPVDTHVYRVASRLGWIRPKTKIDIAHEELERIIPSQTMMPMHLYIIQHGRKTCRARNPKCDICPIADYCYEQKFRHD